MKSFLYINKILPIIFIILFVSCASKPENKIDSAYIMVYENNDSGVMDATIYLDNKVLGSTDIYGRFTFPCNEKDLNVHTILVEKNGYESISLETTVVPGQLLYFRIYDGEYYAQMAEKELDSGNINKALELIEHALAIEDRKDYQYLKKVIELRIVK